jgi:hypothetical protein
MGTMNKQSDLPTRRICGVDFDNTIVHYDDLLARIVQERSLLPITPGDTKRSIRDRIRQLPNGEIEWQKCQALMYGPRISEASLNDGVLRFFQLCRTHNVKVYVISHKTEHSRYDPAKTNLRQAAKDWMESRGCFGPAGLDPRDVFFANTREEKINRVIELGCTHFIDDLEETFLEKSFPPSTARILYEPGRTSPAPEGIRLMKSWREICEYFFASS